MKLLISGTTATEKCETDSGLMDAELCAVMETHVRMS